MRAKDAFAVKVLRYLKSNLDSSAKEKLAPLTDEEVIRVINKRIKQSADSIEKYRAGNRAELAEAEQREADMIAKYLPAQMPEADIESLARSLAKQTGASGSKDFGRLMGAVVKAVAGRADGKTVKAVVERVLQG